MISARLIPAVLALVLAAALAPLPAFAQGDEQGTRWLEERREERLKEQRERARENAKRDPLVPPGASSSSYPPPGNPLAPRTRSLAPGTLPWNVR